jgi:hypothetical protein
VEPVIHVLILVLLSVPSCRLPSYMLL